MEKYSHSPRPNKSMASNPEAAGRSLRKRKSPDSVDSSVQSSQMKKARVSTPVKSIISLKSNKDIKKFYLNKSVKIIFNSLETIFEEKAGCGDEEDNVIFMSKKAIRRIIKFEDIDEPTAAKLKKRESMVKKFFGAGALKLKLVKKCKKKSKKSK